jgi:hypothetical protein
MDLSAEVDKPMDRIPAQHVLQTLVSSSERQHHDILNYARNQMADVQARFDIYAASMYKIELHLEHVCNVFQGSGPWHLVSSTSSLMPLYHAPCRFVVKTAALCTLAQDLPRNVSMYARHWHRNPKKRFQQATLGERDACDCRGIGGPRALGDV